MPGRVDSPVCLKSKAMPGAKTQQPVAHMRRSALTSGNAARVDQQRKQPFRSQMRKCAAALIGVAWDDTDVTAGLMSLSKHDDIWQALSISQ